MQPTPITPTQTRHPWRATLRTVAAAALALIPLLPLIVDAAGLRNVAWVVVVLAIAGAITRVLAVPGVNTWLARYVPPLAAAPKADIDDRL